MVQEGWASDPRETWQRWVVQDGKGCLEQMAEVVIREVCVIHCRHYQWHHGMRINPVVGEG